MCIEGFRRVRRLQFAACLLRRLSVKDTGVEGGIQLRGGLREILDGESQRVFDAVEGVDTAERAGVKTAEPEFRDQALLLFQDRVAVPPGRLLEGDVDLHFRIDERTRRLRRFSAELGTAISRLASPIRAASKIRVVCATPKSFAKAGKNKVQ